MSCSSFFLFGITKIVVLGMLSPCDVEEGGDLDGVEGVVDPGVVVGGGVNGSF